MLRKVTQVQYAISWVELANKLGLPHGAKLTAVIGQQNNGAYIYINGQATPPTWDGTVTFYVTEETEIK